MFTREFPSFSSSPLPLPDNAQNPTTKLGPQGRFGRCLQSEFPNLFSLVCTSKHAHRAAHSRRAPMLPPSLVCPFFPSQYSALTCGLSAPISPCLPFDLPFRSCIRGLFNIGVPHLRHLRRWKRRGDWSRFECARFHALAVHHSLNYFFQVLVTVSDAFGVSRTCKV